MSTTIELITTADGSTSLYNPALNETYHSRHGAVAESLHVFIKEGLQYYIEKHNPTQISIFEVGFGTGLNALLTLIEAAKYPAIEFYYETIDTFPMPLEVVETINYPELLDADKHLFREMHSGAFEVNHRLGTNFTLKKIKNDIHLHQSEQLFNIVYFDAFAPEKQPDMWESAVFERLYGMMLPNANLVTYCAQGQFKRTAKTAGFVVERVQGPPFKREMTRVTKPIA